MKTRNVCYSSVFYGSSFVGKFADDCKVVLHGRQEKRSYPLFAVTNLRKPFEAKGHPTTMTVLDYSVAVLPNHYT
uniref:Sema domain-containing protein n=1 Tax=Syphacia muris TaxID=451379 RepID=A0A0N5APE2_9BILA